MICDTTPQMTIWRVALPVGIPYDTEILLEHFKSPCPYKQVIWNNGFWWCSVEMAVSIEYAWLQIFSNVDYNNKA